jgi:putative SOS response-associated peptidase YedK
MCGRYIQASSPRLLAEHFDVDELAITESPEPDYNVAPRVQVLAVVQSAPDLRVLEPMRWGLIPSWATETRIGDRLINARAESVAEKPAFKTAFEKRRCIVPADGFYEWQRRGGSKTKQPMFVHRRDGDPLAFAGLWEVWRAAPDDDWLLSCAIVTTRANAMMEPIHNRMPVILPRTAWDAWLDRDVHGLAQLSDLLEPVADDLLEMWPVSTAVNSARNNGPELTKPVPPDTLFP